MVLDKTARSIYNWMFSIEQGIAGCALLYMKTSRDQEVELRFSVAGAICMAKNSKEFMEREKP
ncbi:hypothetical protein HanXRQr2_Chr06g0278291 [Helianthus annuus]|uniref:Uncharacterized protein n=1 Tax=Helianthus annuus TaxID=4232 RepID=A0A251ULQ9_HELAN|nr:hypothetical protein HanXRQr2_Chr06g0278291 [Helianthus annuus]KAJ0917083.1 hypothetical protein HanPSC8_Chr06g0269241 [Helianthus annuus]